MRHTRMMGTGPLVSHFMPAWAPVATCGLSGSSKYRVVPAIKGTPASVGPYPDPAPSGMMVIYLDGASPYLAHAPGTPTAIFPSSSSRTSMAVYRGNSSGCLSVLLTPRGHGIATIRGQVDDADDDGVEVCCAAGELSPSRW